MPKLYSLVGVDTILLGVVPLGTSILPVLLECETERLANGVSQDQITKSFCDLWTETNIILTNEAPTDEAYLA